MVKWVLDDEGALWSCHGVSHCLNQFRYGLSGCIHTITFDRVMTIEAAKTTQAHLDVFSTS